MNHELIQKKYIKECGINEDSTVIDFLKKLDTNKNYNYLEAGAGLGRFPLLLKNELKLKNLNITCLDANETLVKELNKKNLKSITGDLIKLPFKDEEFDIVHCSHVIEHLGYPEITKALDEIFRIAKIKGYVIIRSPLMHPNFYNDIDHIRPYPPKTILQYFNNKQQKKIGEFKIKLISSWKRKQATNINLSIRGTWYLNNILKKMWTNYNFPSGKANGYVAIFQKL